MIEAERHARLKSGAAAMADEPVTYLIGGSRPDGTSFYAYLRLTVRQCGPLMEALASGSTLRLEDFGEILYWNLGESPSPEVRAHMAKHHQVDEELELKLSSLLG
jgi:hypothetical protein